MAATPPNAGAKAWEDAMQSNQPYPAQPAIPVLNATPEGVIYANPGAVCTDIAGNLYVKSTDASVNTGWLTVTGT